MADYRIGGAPEINPLEALFKLNKDLTDQNKVNMEAEQRKTLAKTMQQARLVDPTTKKTMAGTFDPNTGQYNTSQHEMGWSPKTDPETGYVLPAAQLEESGQAAVPPAAFLGQPAPQANPAQQIPQQSQQPMQAPAPAPQLNPKQREGVEKGIQRLDTDPVYKKAKDSVTQINQLHHVASQALSNPQANASLGAEMAKYIEGGGRMTDQDVVRYIKDPSLKGGVRQFLNRFTTGTQSPEDINNIVTLLEGIRGEQQQIMGNLGSVESERQKSIYNTPSNLSKQAIQPPTLNKMLQPSKAPEAQQAKDIVEHPRDLSGFMKKANEFLSTKGSAQETPEQELARLKAKHGKK